MIHVVLFRPQIPPNTGNIGRLCAVTGCPLHLIHPLGFKITDRHLRRSGMDYWYELDVRHHADWQAFQHAPDGPKRCWLMTTRGGRSLWDVAFEPGDALVFGNEGEGAPEWLHETIGEESRICIPHFRPGLRSLNLSTAAGVAVYEAHRQFVARGLIVPSATVAGEAALEQTRQEP